MKKTNYSRATKLAALLSLICLNSASAEIVDIPTTVFGQSSRAAAQPGRTTGVVQASASKDESDKNVDQVQFAQVPTPLEPAPPLPTAPPAPTPLGQAPLGQAPGAELPVTPNLPINQLAPPPAANFQNFGNAALPASLGATAGSFSAAPNMIGDFFGGGTSILSGSQTVVFEGYAAGNDLSPSQIPGAFTADLAFEFGTDIVPNDIFTISGSGQDLDGSNDGFADTFDIFEPIPPNDALTSPGPGFTFDGGQAVYTNNTTSTDPQSGAFDDGDQWYIKYSYTSSINDGQNGGGGSGNGVRSFVPVPGPGVSARRIKISENFSPEVRDRFFLNYSFFNDAYGGLGDISRYVMGVERILVDNLVSIEVRLPMAGTYGSFQQLDRAESRNFELGNLAVIAKGILLRTNSLLLSSGLGVTVPTADDTSLAIANREILRIENETFHLLPFVAAMYRLNQKTAIQTYMQLDVAANGDPVLGNLFGGTLENLGTFNDSTLMHIDTAMSRRIYQNQRARFLRSVSASGELHYTGTLQASDVVDSGGLRYTNLKPNFNVVNTTMGLHLQLGDRLVVTPAMAVPLRDGLDKQFDYEAIVQVNYLR